MPQTLEKPKFPKFMAHLYANGMDVKVFTAILNNKGYEKYKYHTVLRKLNGESSLHYEDIVIFCKVLGLEESIFFN